MWLMTNSQSNRNHISVPAGVLQLVVPVLPVHSRPPALDRPGGTQQIHTLLPGQQTGSTCSNAVHAVHAVHPHTCSAEYLQLQQWLAFAACTLFEGIHAILHTMQSVTLPPYQKCHCWIELTCIVRRSGALVTGLA